MTYLQFVKHDKSLYSKNHVFVFSPYIEPVGTRYTGRNQKKGRRYATDNYSMDIFHI